MSARGGLLRAVRGGAAGTPGPVLPLPELAGALVLLALLVVIYRGSAADLWDTWMNNDNYSHGPLVPLVSLALVWMRRGDLWRTPSRPDARGLLLVGLACVMMVLGVRGDVFALRGWSFVVLLFGLSLTFLGPTLTGRLAFPIGFLVFMLTFPPVFMNGLSFKLKELAVTLSSAVGHGLGARFEREGMSLFFPTGHMLVDHPCSGLRSLLALLAFGALLAELTPGHAARRLLLVAGAIPVALLANAARLTALILMADARDVATATGAWHDVTGYLLYAVALAGMLVLKELVLPARPVRVREPMLEVMP